MNRTICPLVLAAAFLIQPPVGQTGFIDKTGKLVVEARYAAALDFSGGLAAVRVGAKCGYIDREGKEKIPLKFDDAKRFREQRAAVKVGEKWGFIDTEGTWVVEPIYLQASSFSEGLAAVQLAAVGPNETGTTEAKTKVYRKGTTVLRVSRASAPKAAGGWGYIDTAGKLVIPHQFVAVQDFSNGLAMVRPRGGKSIWMSDAEVAELDKRGMDYVMERFVFFADNAFEAAGYIDKTGTMVIPPRFSTAVSFREGLAYVEQFTNVNVTLRGYIDTTGKPVIELARNAVRPPMEIGVESLLQLNQIRFDDPIGLIPAEPGPIAHKDGLALVDSGTGFVHAPKWTYVDTSGKVIVENVGEFSSSFSEGLAAVGKGGFSRGKTGYVDRTGKFVIPCQYDAGGHFSEGLAPVLVGKRWGYIDPSGKVLIDTRFEKAASFSEGLARVTLPK